MLESMGARGARSRFERARHAQAGSARARCGPVPSVDEARRRRHGFHVAVFPPLVARAQNGSLDAYRDLVAVFQDRMFALSVALCVDPHRALRAAAHAFVRAHGTLGSLTDVNQVPTWLRHHVQNTSLAVASGPSSELLARLAALPREQERTTTALARIAGEGDQRVAEFLDLPVATVHNRLEAARRRLKRRAWRELGERYSRELPSKSRVFTDTVMGRLRG